MAILLQITIIVITTKYINTVHIRIYIILTLLILYIYVHRMLEIIIHIYTHIFIHIVNFCNIKTSRPVITVYRKTHYHKHQLIYVVLIICIYSLFICDIMLHIRYNVCYSNCRIFVYIINKIQL